MIISKTLEGKVVLLRYEIKKHKHEQHGIIEFVGESQILFKPFELKGFTVDFDKISRCEEIIT
jgi:hypothetical protein